MKRFLNVFLLCMGLVFGFIQSGAAEQKPRVLDGADLLKPPQIAVLEDQLERFRFRQSIDLVIVTTNNTDGRTSNVYAHDVYHQHGFGIGAEKSAIMLLIDLENMHSDVIAKGEAERLLGEIGIGRLKQRQASELKKGNYYQVFATTIKEAASILSRRGSYEATRSRGSVSGGSATDSSGDASLYGQIVVSMIFGMGISFFITAFAYYSSHCSPGTPPPLQSPRCRLTLTIRDDSLVDTKTSTRRLDAEYSPYYSSSYRSAFRPDNHDR